MDKRINQTIWSSPQNKALLVAFSRLKTKSELQNFLRDLLTESEIKEFSARWQAAQMLDRGIPYTQIIQDTGLSSTTVARVQRWLKSGMGGYRLMINRLSKYHPRS